MTHYTTFCCFNYDYFIDDLNGKVPVDPDAEMIYWQRQDGGRVFNGGAIGNGIALNYDPVFDGLVRNVLRTFLRCILTGEREMLRVGFELCTRGLG